MSTLPGPRQADPVAARHRRARRRLPPDRRRDGQPRTARRADVRRRRDPDRRRLRRRSVRSPTACRSTRTNLVARALDLAGSRRAHVTIDKRIPHGGGLGGGSTDAATALRWAGFGTSAEQLERAGRRSAPTSRSASSAGAPACRGIGEIVEPLPHVERARSRSIIPPLHVSTPAVYRAWDELDPRVETASTQRSRGRGASSSSRSWRGGATRSSRHIGTAPTLAGSGATWFVEGCVRRRELDRPRGTLGATIVQTHTVDAGRATGPGA